MKSVHYSIFILSILLSNCVHASPHDENRHLAIEENTKEPFFVLHDQLEVYCRIRENTFKTPCHVTEAYCRIKENTFKQSCEQSEAYCSKKENLFKYEISI